MKNGFYSKALRTVSTLSMESLPGDILENIEKNAIPQEALVPQSEGYRFYINLKNGRGNFSNRSDIDFGSFYAFGVVLVSWRVDKALSDIKTSEALAQMETPYTPEQEKQVREDISGQLLASAPPRYDIIPVVMERESGSTPAYCHVGAKGKKLEKVITFMGNTGVGVRMNWDAYLQDSIHNVFRELMTGAIDFGGYQVSLGKKSEFDGNGEKASLTSDKRKFAENLMDGMNPMSFEMEAVNKEGRVKFMVSLEGNLNAVKYIENPRDPEKLLNLRLANLAQIRTLLKAMEIEYKEDPTKSEIISEALGNDISMPAASEDTSVSTPD